MTLKDHIGTFQMTHDNSGLHMTISDHTSPHWIVKNSMKISKYCQSLVAVSISVCEFGSYWDGDASNNTTPEGKYWIEFKKSQTYMTNWRHNIDYFIQAY